MAPNVTEQRPFEELHPWEKGFAAVFAREIAPRLGPLERKRRAIVSKRRNRLLAIAVVAAAALAAIWAGLDDHAMAAVLSAFVAFGALAATFIVFSLGQEAFEERVKEEIMPPIAAFLGVRFDPKAGERPDPALFHEAGLIAAYERASFADGVAGTHRGVDFSACEARFTKTERESDGDGKSRRRTVTVFSGVIASFSLPRPAPGRIVIRIDAGRVLNAVFGFFERTFRGLEKVDVPHAGFEAAFEVRAENPDAARAFIAGPFLDGLLALARGSEEAPPRLLAGAFVDDRFLLTLSGQTLISVGPASESLDAIEPRLRETLAEMRSPLRMIDRFLGG